MSWIERIQNDLVIKTGDGQEFRPNWMNAVKTKEYNVTEFNFSNVPGSLVTRELPKGSRYGLEIHFQGENNIEDANLFEVSADDKRAWEISHPYYDLIIVQPISLQRDNTIHNVTKFNISVVETITEDNPRTSQDPVNKIISDQGVVSESFSEDFEINVDSNTELVNEMNDNNDSFFSFGEKISKTNEDFQDYFNSYNTATASINNGISNVGSAIRSLQTVINAPALFSQSIKVRVQSIEDQFNTLRGSVGNLLNKSSKKLYENNAGDLISSLTVGLVTNVEYKNRSEVLEYVDKVIELYSNYMTDLDSIQSDNSNSPESYMPSYKSQRFLNDLINYSISNLFRISVDARQERFVILENDDNIINLAHRFYGLEVDDSTIDDFVDSNEIGINEQLGLKKGRTIVYFV